MSARNFAFVIANVAGLSAPGFAHADSLDPQRALELIESTADRICNVVLTQGEAKSSEVQGKVNAQLSGLASKFVEAGVSGAESINNEDYKSVLRQDLAATLKDNAACKLNVFNTLQSKLLGPAPAPAPLPEPTPPPAPRMPEPQPDKRTNPEPTNVRRHAGMDAPGNDRGSWIKHVGTVDDCESICLADPGCAGYTYNVRRSTCIPKNRISSLVPNNEEPVTGVVLGRAGGSSGLKVIRYPNMDAPGNDLRWVRGIGSVEQCESLCLAESNCAGYTYNITKFTCIPKTSIGSFLPSRDPAVTGVVNARTR